jgi:uncharacterized protein (DUF2267 family)
MNHQEIREEVKGRLAINENDWADEIIEAVLVTLSERISEGEAKNLAAQLPEPYKTYVRTVKDVEVFGVEDFFDRVAGKLRTGRGPATHYAQAVMGVINEAVSSGELSDIMAQLPRGYDILFENPTV